MHVGSWISKVKIDRATSPSAMQFLLNAKIDFST
jgi:hypothetical protein